MARPGELEFYAAASGLSLGSLADHKLAYYGAQGFTYGTLRDREYAFFLSRTGLSQAFADYDSARYAYFKGQLGSGYDIDSMMRDFFAAPPIVNLADYPRGDFYHATAGKIGFRTSRWFGNNGQAAGTHTLVTGAADGPGGITTYARKTWPGTILSNNNGDTGFDTTLHGVSSLPATEGETIFVGGWLRASTAKNFEASISAFDAAGNPVGSRVRGPLVFGEAGKWVWVSGNLVVPAGGKFVSPFLDVSGTLTGGATLWAASDTLDGTKLFVRRGSYSGVYSDGSTPGWAWDGTPGASSSRGPEYTITRVAGAAPAGMNVGAQTTQVPPPHPLSARTGYVVWDITGFADNFSAPMTMGDPVAANGLLRVQTSAPTTGTSVASRVDTVGGSVNAPGGNAPTGRTIGRHATMANLREGATHARFRHDGGALTPGSPITPGSGIPGSNFITASAAGGFAPVVAYQFFAEHNDAVSQAVMTWLANAYGIPFSFASGGDSPLYGDGLYGAGIYGS